MEILDHILSDWQECRPVGVVIPATRFNDVVKGVSARVISSSSPGQARRDAQSMLYVFSAVSGTSTSLLARMLRVDCEDANSRIHFLRYWQAMQEIWRRLRRPDNYSCEPLAEEIATFRDTILRRVDEPGALTTGWLVNEVRSSMAMSADACGWYPISHSAELLLTGAGIDSAGRVMLLEEMSTLLFSWLQELTEDYRRGGRSAKLKAVCDVAGCGNREAAFHLGSTDWDVETALCSFFGLPAPPSCDAWSSQGVKLRRSEVECPICIEAYGATSKPLVTDCCFQALCTTCYSRLIQPGGFQCPFCRTIGAPPRSSWLERAQRRGPPFGGRFSAYVLQAAGRAARATGRVLEDLASAAHGVHADSPVNQRVHSAHQG